METIKVYETSDIGASQSLVTLEGFIGDMDNAELADDSTVDTSDAVTAINGLIFALEQRDAENERLRAVLINLIADLENDGLAWRASVADARLALGGDEQSRRDEPSEVTIRRERSEWPDRQR